MDFITSITNKERIAMVDALRGLALLGIILANVPVSTSLKYANYLFIDSANINGALETAKHILISTKFITIFSILFGFGFYVQLNRAAQKSINFRQYYFVRMLFLFIIGCLHAYLLWFGDIIRYYAICGMLLLLFQQVSTKKLLILSVILLVPLTAIVFILNGIFGLQQYDYDYSIPEKMYYVKSYLQYLCYNATIDPMVNFVQDSPITFISCFGKILFGYWLGRIGFFFNPLRFKVMLQRWTWYGLLGVAGSIGFWAVSTGKLELGLPLLWLPFFIAAGLVLHSLLYIAVFVRLFQGSIGKKLLMLFAPIGKMALTNYLLQTLFYLIFFYRWTHILNLNGKISLVETYLLALFFYMFQIIMSHWWMNRFSQGPVEYIWKKLTYKAARITKKPVLHKPYMLSD